jgi:hypothetical protein
MNTTFLDNVDTTKVTELLDKTSKNVEYFNNVTKQVTEEYTEHLDKLMQEFYIMQKDLDNVPTEKLEQIYLELTNLLYFMGTKLEQLGMHNDMSKAMRQEVYNKAYLDNQVKDTDKKNKTTIAENQAVAEEASKYESAVNSIYDRSYKIIKFKIDAGYEFVNTLRKVISRRMQETELSMYSRRSE